MIQANKHREFSKSDLWAALHEMRDKAGKRSLRTLEKYCPQIPLPTQMMALDCEYEELLFGGEAGGGKSSWLGMEALADIDHGECSVLCLRVDKKDFWTKAGLGTRITEWCAQMGQVVRKVDDVMIFPSGARIQFGHMKTKQDAERYLSQEYHKIIWEELTTFNLPDDSETVNPFLWINRSLRRLVDSPIRCVVRAATNPGRQMRVGGGGGNAHAFVKNYFTNEEVIKEIREEQTRKIFHVGPSRGYLHCYGEDNVHVDMKAYRKRLDKLDTVSRQRQKHGDWTIVDNSVIQASMFRFYRETDIDYILMTPDKTEICRFPKDSCSIFVTVDAGGTSAERARMQRGDRSSYTAIGVWMVPPARFGKALLCKYVLRQRLSIPELKEQVVRINRKYCPHRILVENEKFGKSIVQLLVNRLPIKEVSSDNKDKATRAVPFIDALGDGNVYYPEQQPRWWPKYRDELINWSGLENDVADQLDMSAYAAIECFVAKPSKWDPHLFGIETRFDQIPNTLSAIGVGVAPALDGEENASIVTIARNGGELLISGQIENWSTDQCILATNRVARSTFGDPAKVLVDHEFYKLARDHEPWLRNDGLRGYLHSKIVPEHEQIANFLDSGIRGGSLKFDSGDTGNGIVSRLVNYPDSYDFAPLRALYLAAHSLI